MLKQQHIDDLIDAVRDISRREILTRFRRLTPLQVTTKSGPWDLVTEADRAVEAAITKAVAMILPGAVVVGEEAVAEGRAHLGDIGKEDLCVIVDPIDGTGNFAAGVSVFGVILAVVERGETVFGLLYDPVMDDWMFASPGAGAWFAAEGRDVLRVSTRAPRPLGAALGLLPLDIWGAAARAEFLHRFSAVAQVRNLRCSCHEYRLLASGQADFLVSSLLKPWDHAAGQLLLMEADGWSRVNRETMYSPLLTKGGLVAASAASVGETIVEIFLGAA